MKTYKNYRPELRDLLVSLEQRGCKIIYVHDGQEALCPQSIDAAVYHLTGVDDSTVSVMCPDAKKTQSIFLVFGNSSGELVNDFSMGSPLLEKIISEHSNRWDGLEVPSITEREYEMENLLYRFLIGCENGEAVGEVYFSKLVDHIRSALSTGGAE